MRPFIDGYEIDITEDEEVTFESEVTEHPTETGGPVSDHIRNKPIVLAFTGVVSDTPVGDLARRRGIVTLEDVVSGAPSPSADAYARLLAIRNDRRIVTVETTRGAFENMAIVSLSVPAPVADVLEFRVMFKQIRRVTNARTTVPVAVPRAARKVTRGAAAATPAGENPARLEARARNRRAEEARRDRLSWLGKGTEAIFGRTWLTGGE